MEVIKMSEKVKVILLDETKKNMEEDIGLSFDKMKKMDLCDIEKHIQSRRTREPKHVFKIYRKSRGSVLASMGRFITRNEVNDKLSKLEKKYLSKQVMTWITKLEKI